MKPGYQGRKAGRHLAPNRDWRRILLRNRRGNKYQGSSKNEREQTMYRVIIIEDETTVRRGIVLTIDWFSLDCIIVGEAANGEEGLELVLRLSPDIVITDVKMPRMDGVEMIQKLRQAGCRSRFIILTAYSDFKYAQSALRLGVSDYLLKPLKDGELEEAVRTLVRTVSGPGTGGAAGAGYGYESVAEKGYEGAARDGDGNGMTAQSGEKSGHRNDPKDAGNAYRHPSGISTGSGVTAGAVRGNGPAGDGAAKAAFYSGWNPYAGTAPAPVPESITAAFPIYGFSSDRTAQNSYVEGAIRYIHRHYQEDISISTVAHALEISEGYLSRMFKKETNYTFTNYLIYYRLRLAMELLMDCRVKIYEVADQVGYSDTAYFSAQFKKIVGLSPSEYQGRFGSVPVKNASDSKSPCAQRGTRHQ